MPGTGAFINQTGGITEEKTVIAELFKKAQDRFPVEREKRGAGIKKEPFARAQVKGFELNLPEPQQEMILWRNFARLFSLSED